MAIHRRNGFRALWRVAFALEILATILIAGAAQAGDQDLVVHAGTLVDGVAAVPRHRVSILIHNDKIVSIREGFVSPAGAKVIDLSTATVLPGFIDVHVHVGMKLPSKVNAMQLGRDTKTRRAAGLYESFDLLHRW